MQVIVIEARVSTNCPSASVKEISLGVLKVRVKSKPIEGKANTEVIRIVSEYFGVKAKSVKIIRGASSNRKTIEITS